MTEQGFLMANGGTVVRAGLVGATAIVLAACAANPPGGSGSSPSGGSEGLSFDDSFTRLVAPFQILDPTGVPYSHPFLGGFDVPRPQLLDLDGDGDRDLYIQERTNEVIYFENVGSATAPRFEWRTNKYQDLEVGEWTRFYDMDDDGDLDLLAETRFSYIRYYRNDGSPTDPRFTLVADTVKDSDGQPIFSDRQNIPNITDIDCDMEPDLFLGRVDGTVSRYERVSVTESGAPVFLLRNARFEGIEIVGDLANPNGVPQFGARPTMHGANSMYFADIDNDGDQDFFWGDFFEAGLLWIENQGSCLNPDLRGEPVPVPASELIATSGYNASAVADMDGDSDLDLLLGVLGGAFNPNTTSADNLYYFERREDGIYEERSRRFLENFDTGSESVVSMGDLDGDGDMDALVGNKLDPVSQDIGRIYHLENIGTASAPAFAMRDTLSLGGAYHLSPGLVDLDADGDLDLALGTWNDDLLYFRNEGSATTPNWVRVGEGPLVELTRGSHSAPEFGDVDGDGDLDLLVGESSGEINHFENVGSATDPRFELVVDKLEGIDVGRRAVPRLIDLDGDGDLDLLVGQENGGAALFRNDGTPQAPHWVPAGELNAPLPRFSTPFLVDMDGDGDLDIISGGMSGGLTYFRNDGPGGLIRP